LLAGWLAGSLARWLAGWVYKKSVVVLTYTLQNISSSAGKNF
jgi:hypothetical protein